MHALIMNKVLLIFVIYLSVFTGCHSRTPSEAEYRLIDSDIFKFYFHDDEKLFNQESGIIIVRMVYEIYEHVNNGNLTLATSPYLVEINSLNIDVRETFLQERPRFFSAVSEIQNKNISQKRSLAEIFHGNNSADRRTHIQAGEKTFSANQSYPYVVVIDSLNENIFELKDLRIPPLFGVNKDLINNTGRGTIRLSSHENYAHTHTDPEMYRMLRKGIAFILRQTSKEVFELHDESTFTSGSHNQNLINDLITDLPPGFPALTE